MKRLLSALTLLVFAPPLFAQEAGLKVAPVFGDHMVLQQEKAVPVWGTAAPGAAVSVKFDGQTVKATADADGKWKLDLAAMKAQLPEFVPDPNWGLYREIHTRIMTLPKTTMVATSDLAPGIHPPDKERYGRRAANVALSKIYGKPVQALGPIYKSHGIDGDKMRITFRETGKGLMAAHAETPQGFMIAGADRKFVWAKARIVSPDTVEVWSDAVKAPAAVRYAYAYAIPWANLFNQDGLPAATFRTDDWTWDSQNPTLLVKLFTASLRRTNWVWEPTPKPVPNL